jgi:hypothetical protein
MKEPPMPGLEIPHQLLLWVDGVGGYLVCLKARLALGQATEKRTADISILADISRHHATIHRGIEGYFFDAVRRTAVNGQEISKSFLHSGDRLTLGDACQLLFSQAVPISGSARLDLVSGQRWQQPVQAVLLMAETLVLGPGPQAHVLVPELEQALILFRTQEGLAVRYGGALLVNGQSCRERARVTPDCQVSADKVSFTLEAL